MIAPSVNGVTSTTPIQPSTTQAQTEDEFPPCVSLRDAIKELDAMSPAERELAEAAAKKEAATELEAEENDPDNFDYEGWRNYSNQVVRNWNEDDRKKIAYANYVQSLTGKVKSKEELYRSLFNFQKDQENKPGIVSLGEFMAKKVDRRPEIITGVLKKQSILILVSASKVGKTWVIIDLALSVANGLDWIGWECKKGRVLVVNFELHEDTAQERFKIVQDAKSEAEDRNVTCANVDIWNLRGYAADVESIVNEVIAGCQDKAPYDLIILDPVYKMLGDLNENNAKDMNKLMNQFDRICTETGAAIAIVGHFPKGSKAGAQTGDRMSGSGVTTRATDSLIELTPAAGQEDQPFPDLDVSGKLRDFKPLVPFVVKMDNFILRRVEGATLTTGANAPKGGKKTITADQYMMLYESPSEITFWRSERVANMSG